MALSIRGDRIRRVSQSMAWTFTAPIVGVLVSLTAVRVGGSAVMVSEGMMEVPLPRD